jgi:alpha-ketoglutarate-dependent 2,4-dichlorophenoxyacetate dioxygenase
VSQLRFEPLHEDFAVRVRGVNLTTHLPDEVVEEIREAIDTYSLLYFPEQPMNDEAHLAFTRRLGEPESEHVTFGKTGEIVYLGSVGNVVDKDTKRDNADPRTHYQKGNEMWHSDSSFRLIPSFVSITHAHEVPGEGGATEFVSMRAAYARLPDELQVAIDPLHVIHDYVFSRTKVAPVDPNHAASLPPIENRLVRTNPGNGRKNYYVGSHARSIVGWSGIDSRKLIDDLNERATRPQDVYTHQWQVGDTVIWDNRCLLHHGGGYDADRWRRLMRQTRVMGAGPTLEEPSA